MISLVALLFSAIGLNYVNAQETTQENYLKVQGKILGDYTANIQVWENNPKEGAWQKIYEKSDKSKYSVRLNPQLEYQIYFISNLGRVKTIYVDAGEAGPWLMKLNINFDALSTNYAKIYQDPNKKYYSFLLLDPEYVNNKKTTIPSSSNLSFNCILKL